MRLTGTKEGCAEGDCGACTVLSASTGTDVCITVLPTPAFAARYGRWKQVVTVEHLAQAGPDPIQRAMADQHASQCGFCTPGFVIRSPDSSCLWLRTSGELPSRQMIDEHLAGNLCRCTGYGPIIDAARQACAGPMPVSWQTFSSAALDIPF
ncbi:MAG: hypothetical protein Ct9H300mP16_15150 [Pseudomonadota bacterium]|nr:MAG: hypothetical protein Ct9H300mP16_15150 [Pseudomonadota bacterium]